ncbi:MAG: nicotinate-nucleotide--dimethylbenzimidazole phosphoribosyltransferase [Acidimicrobiia bacterium]
MTIDDVTELLASMPQPDLEARAAVEARSAEVLRPVGALARCDEIAAWLAGWQRTSKPSVSKPFLVLAAADHGVVARGVSAYPPEVTKGMVAAIKAGVATSSVLAREAGAGVYVIDAGVGEPTGDIVTGPALSSEVFSDCFQKGRDVVSGLDCDILAIGEMGIGNTTASSAVASAVIGGDPRLWVGRGTGITDAGLKTKREAVSTAVDRVGTVDPIEALRQLGGGELVALAGAVTEARLRSIPVVLDGFTATAAVIPLEAAVAGALDHCIASHLSAEPGHVRMLEWLGKEPLLKLDLRLGEGSGALLAIPLIRMAAAAVVEVSTFAEWGLA